ncbi:ATP-dependent endonuclease [Niveibacterium sp. COAC-50]|uniref:ATP-dependent nuclease n=1 Tax=Niveibacterium sp. COAC-50 TaxID=2729384 RepID=UPI00155339A0|nr:AAA family ATPase [Niveibacterium sp. COAC-50]
MSVRLETVEIRNYKSCKDTKIQLERFTPLIGYNNSGKSNIISAIQWLLRKSVLDEESFNDMQLPVEVIGRVIGVSVQALSTLTPEQQQKIQPYIDNEALTLKRVQPCPGGKATDIKLHILNPANSQWTANPTGIDNAISSLLPEPIRIGAMEDAAEDSAKAKNTTTIGKLLSEFIEPVRRAHEADINQHLGQVEKQLSADGASRLAEFNTIDQSINHKINDLFPGIGVKLHFPVPSMEDLIKAGTVKVYEDAGISRGFSAYGHGAQRAIQMALVRHLAEVKRGVGQAGGTTLLLIDEPELYLHPFAVEHIREALKTLSENGYQIVASTHSAQMVKAKDAQHSLLIRKSPAKGTFARRRLRDAIQIAVPDSTHAMEQLFTLGHASQLLFSDKVLLTEGKTELRLLPAIFEHINTRTLGQNKIALIAQSGVNDTKKSMQILQEMDLPSKAIVDLDYAFKGGHSHGFVPPGNAHVAEIKRILARLEAAKRITLDQAGLPTKGVVKASEAYAILAKELDAAPHIDALHNLLLGQDIWLWKKGSIEDHLGLQSKDERAWAHFQTELDRVGIQALCPDPQSVVDMVAWVAA